MQIYKRHLEIKIKELLFKGRAILIFGPRQAGKTTLAKKIVSEFGSEGEYFNCELMEVRKHFELGQPNLLKDLVKDKKIVVFDEAQTIQNIGAILKAFIDTYPQVQIITTGSSSFDLANKINEPLTGRSFEFILYPLSISEIAMTKKIEENDLLNFMNFGMYPAVVGEDNVNIKLNLLKNITTNYLYKDIYIFENIKNPKLFEDLLILLANQIGGMLSVNKLAEDLKTSRETIDKYLRLLEQSYVIYRLKSYSKNFRGEIKKAFKIYFIDNGVRNAILGALDTNIKNRDDKGKLFENFAVLEFYKKWNLSVFSPRLGFWRNDKKLEIDLIKDSQNNLEAYEMKFGDEKVVFKIFLSKYPKAETFVVNLKNILSFLN